MQDKNCCSAHLENQDPEAILLLNRPAAARAGLNQLSGREMCRRCAVFLAAAHDLDLDRDFTTWAAQARAADHERRRRTAMDQLVGWVVQQDLLPTVCGKPPKINGFFLCRRCGEPRPTGQLIVLQRRFVQALHPQLTQEASRPETILEGRAFCEACFKVLCDQIDELGRLNGVDHVVVWQPGKSHLTLQEVFTNDAKRHLVAAS